MIWVILGGMKNGERKIEKKIGEKVFWLEERRGGILVGVDIVFCSALIHASKQMPKIQKNWKMCKIASSKAKNSIKKIQHDRIVDQRAATFKNPVDSNWGQNPNCVW